MNSRALTAVRWGCASLIVLAVLIRLMSAHPRTPWWDLDPVRQPIPETTLLPSTGLALDAMVWAASALGVAACLLAGARLRWRAGLLVLAGCAGAAYHVELVRAVRSGSGPDDLFTGSVWGAAMVGGWALLHLAADPAIRRTLAVTLAGAAWVLAARGAHQVFIEHARTVAEFKSNAPMMLISQGLEPGSAGAREFERRLMQPEATGWVGLSNAHASVMAGCCAVLLALAAAGLVSARSKHRDANEAAARGALNRSGEAGLLVIAALVGLFGLVLAFSKGGAAAALVAVGLLALSAGLGARVPGRRLALLGVCLPLLALGAVVIRGQIGEGSGERSLLFRWHYLVGAWNIISDSPPLGVGPGGFKAAYALHKPPLNPELVESPHSLFFDWISTLGVGGAAWTIAVIAWTCRAGSGLRRHPVSSPESPNAPWAGQAVVVAACVAASAREAPTMSIDAWPLLAVGALGWLATIAIGCRVSLRDGDGWLFAGLAAGALAVVTHAQVEVTPVLPATCGWFMAILCLAAARPGDAPTESLASTPAAAHTSRRGALACAVIIILIGATASVSLLARRSGVRDWERKLRSAAAAFEDYTPVASQCEAAAEDPEALRACRRLLAALVGHPVEPTSAASTAARTELFQGAVEAASSDLMAARAMHRSNLKPVEHAVRLHIELARQLLAMGEKARAVAVAKKVIVIVNRVTLDVDSSNAFLAQSAGACEAAFHLTGDEEFLWRSIERWNGVVQQDPYSLTPALRYTEAVARMGWREEAALSAKRCLELNELLRLDPLKQLTAAQIRLVEALSRLPAKEPPK